jgi:dTDP-4-amino-4,6-dideoxygalactose transaminase
MINFEEGMSMDVSFFIPWISDADKRAVLEALNTPWLTGGPRSIEFEEHLASFLGVQHVVTVNSCTAALHLAMRGIDITQGDEVIVPVLTFAATANAPLFCGAKPVFADIHEQTFNIAPEDIMNKITSKTKAVIVVHYGGQPCDMKEIMDIAQSNKITVIEDCAHALGARYHTHNVGSIGTMGCFSFYPTKVITTFEGGAITTDDAALARRLRLLRGHAMTRSAFEREKGNEWYYDVTDVGYNYRLNEPSAALGISQLQRVEEINQRRITAAQYYTTKLDSINGIIPPYESPGRTHLYHLYVIKILEETFGHTRNEVFRHLSAKNIGLSVHYTPLHLLTYYRDTLAYKTGDFPVAERVYNQILSLPIFPTMTTNHVDYISQELYRLLQLQEKC